MKDARRAAEVTQQGELFPEPQTIIGPHPARTEPILWVRRILIWAEPDELIREVELRRGLNIVWSPDAGTDTARLGAAEASGHGAGKSLFCRLIRYCLGEHSFATSELAARIGKVLPEGWVGAELSLAGETWGVVRPLGHGKKTRVGKGPPEELLGPGKNRPGMPALLGALTEKVLTPGLEAHMPGTKDARGWLTALAWLSRDQDCRFGHILEWRHTATESDSPVLGLSKEAHLIAVRLLLGIVTPRELAARREHEEVTAGQKRVERQIDTTAEKLTELTERLREAFPSGDPSLGPLWVSALGTQAEERLRAAEVGLDEAERAPDLSTREEERHHTLRELAEIWAQASASVTIVELLRRERARLAAGHTHTCPHCHASLEAMSVSEATLEDAEARLATEEREAAERRRREEVLVARAAAMTEAMEAVAAETKTRQREARAGWFEARRLEEEVKELSARLGEKETLTRELERLGRERERLEDEIESHRKAHDKEVARLEGLFKYVCKGLIGSEREASLTLTADRLRAQVSLGGTAMESLKSVAFDLSALLLGIEQDISLPAFLIHDSPREADLGASHYQNIFRFAAELEGLGEAPPFQYIITTTTDPPPELVTDEYVRLRLSGSSPEDRLLRMDL